jgi:hypothetical protein
MNLLPSNRSPKLREEFNWSATLPSNMKRLMRMEAVQWMKSRSEHVMEERMDEADSHEQ